MRIEPDRPIAVPHREDENRPTPQPNNRLRRTARCAARR
jgi:hypothetical protein